MKPEKIVCNSLEELDAVAKVVLEKYPENRIFGLLGSMGAGKTTFIQSFCRVLGVEDVVNSPTFSIVNEYRTINNDPVFHFDLYRIKSPAELLDIGFEEYLYSDAYCLIEWPLLAGNLLPEGTVFIEITVDPDSECRFFSFT